MIDWTTAKADGLTRCILESPFAAPKALRDAVTKAAADLLEATGNGCTRQLEFVLSQRKEAVLAAEEKHRRYLRALAHYALANRFAPLASHALYTQWLDDNDPAQRKLGIKAGFAWAEGVKFVLVGCDLGVSTGMELGIGFHRVAGREVRMVHLGTQWGRTQPSVGLAPGGRWHRRFSDRDTDGNPKAAPADDTERGHLPDFSNGEHP